MSAKANMQAPVLESSWLVQRLKKPQRSGGLLGKDNPFSFGGGLRNGGLSNEGMDLLRDIFAFDYMGAAEFEWGAVPEALQKIARSNPARFSFTVPLSEVPRNWRDKSKTEPVGEATIYVLCPQESAHTAEARISAWARDPHLKLKERLGLTEALRPVEEWDREICGWLELDNGFLFFTDQEMWDRTCVLFEVTAPTHRPFAGGA